MERFVYDADELPGAIAARIIECVAVRPAVVAATVVVYGKACAADLNPGKRIAKNAAAVST